MTTAGKAVIDLFEYSDDDYDNSDIGLTEADYLRFGADVSAPLGQAASLYASYYQEHIKTDQANSQSFSQPDWSATTDDEFKTATAGITYPDVLGPVDATLEYTWSQAVGEVRSNTSGLPDRFPSLAS